MGLLSIVDIHDAPMQCYLNTGTLFDLQTGEFVPGTHGGMVLNGGLGLSNAFVGRKQMYKSTEMLSYIVRAMSYYTDAEAIVKDTEEALKKERVLGFSPFDNIAQLRKNLVITSSVDMTPEEWFVKVKVIHDEKVKHRDDYLVETPLVDPQTNKPIMMLKPTILGVDSWSQMMSGKTQDTYDSVELGSSDTNMVFMTDGRIKKMMIAQMPNLAARGGLRFMLSAHVGDKFDMNPRAPSAKDLQYMRSSDKIKEVGSNFSFLMSNSTEMRSVEVLMHDNKEDTIYPNKGSNPMELIEVISVMLRNKNNQSGTQLSTVVSQKKGILSDLTHYHYLRKHGKYFGLLGGDRNHKPALLDVSLSRTTVREKLVDPQLCRALELLAQLCYIQNNWILDPNYEVDFTMTPDKLGELLLVASSPTIRDILQSRGYWTYDKTNLQPYLSLYDVLAIAQGVYKTRGVSLAGLSGSIPPATPVIKAKAA